MKKMVIHLNQVWSTSIWVLFNHPCLCLPPQNVFSLKWFAFSAISMQGNPAFHCQNQQDWCVFILSGTKFWDRDNKRITIFDTGGILVGGWTNPFEKYSSNWKPSPRIGVKKHIPTTTYIVLALGRCSPTNTNNKETQLHGQNLPEHPWYQQKHFDGVYPHVWNL